MEDIISGVANLLTSKQNAALDNAFFKLLRSHGITNSKNAEEIREALRRSRFEVIRNSERIDGATVETFKLYKVVDEIKVKLLDPKINGESINFN